MAKRLLFLCSRNRRRSPTAEAIFATYPGVEVESAGLSPDAEVLVCAEQVAWADVILVMERVHRSRLNAAFGPHLADKRVVVLGIRDDYEYMDDELVRLLRQRCRNYLPPVTPPQPMTYTDRFRDWLAATSSPRRMGEVLVIGHGGGDGAEARDAYHLRHWRDAVAKRDALRSVEGWPAWRAVIRDTAEGEFRPLKAAPNLLRGWSLGPLGFDDLVLALQYLYPAELANWHLHEAGTLPVVPYAETAERQTGRFKIVAKITPEQLDELASEHCAQGCLKRRLWEPAEPGPAPLCPPDETLPAPTARVRDAAPELPLLCPEACNWFVGKAREKLKGPAEE